MTPEDEEFNRIEMESRIKQEYVRSMKKINNDFDREYAKTMTELMEELALARVLIRELGDRLAKLEKPWVGLTDDELPSLAGDNGKVMDLEQTRKFYKVIERLLKEKNA